MSASRSRWLRSSMLAGPRIGPAMSVTPPRPGAAPVGRTPLADEPLEMHVWRGKLAGSPQFARRAPQLRAVILRSPRRCCSTTHRTARSHPAVDRPRQLWEFCGRARPRARGLCSYPVRRDNVRKVVRGAIGARRGDTGQSRTNERVGAAERYHDLAIRAY
jgi:hypothetical protein